MTDRHAGYVVVLDEDIREDDAETILTALRMVKHVISVEPVIGDVSLMLAESRVRLDVANEITDAVHSIIRGRSDEQSSTRDGESA